MDSAGQTDLAPSSASIIALQPSGRLDRRTTYEWPFGDDEVSPPVALDDMAPNEEEFRQATGNEGVSFDRTRTTSSGVSVHRPEVGGLGLIYRTRNTGGEWREVNDLVPLAWTEAYFNGRRQWFICPSCHRRCLIIYGGSHYRCRKCHWLKYESR